MTAKELLGALRRRGIVVVPDTDGTLRYRPRDALSAADHEALASHREAILAAFDRDPVGWRVDVMTTQLPTSGAIPLLLARPGIRFPLGSCCSCGAPRPADHTRCLPCGEAAVRVLAGPTSGSWPA